MTILEIDTEALGQAMDQANPERDALFDRELGRLVFPSPRVLSAVERGDEKALRRLSPEERLQIPLAEAILSDTDDRFIYVPQIPAVRRYRWSVEFLEGVENRFLKRQLEQALASENPIRAFEDVLHRTALVDLKLRAERDRKLNPGPEGEASGEWPRWCEFYEEKVLAEALLWLESLDFKVEPPCFS